MLPAPFLHPEHLTGGEVGLDFNRPGLRSQFTLYQSDINNYIEIEPTTNSVYSPAGWYVVQNVNIASVRARGFEAQVNWDILSDLSASLAYTYAQSITESNPLDPASVGQQVIDVPRDKIALGLTYRNREGWSVAPQVYYVSRTDWASPDHTNPGYPGATSADAHALVDLTGTYQFSKHIEGYLKIHNLLDRRYIATSYSAPSAQVYGAPFEAFAGIRITMNNILGR
jgi:outer membrane receptor protein involved in Fe transport